MLLDVPASLDSLLSLFSYCFTLPTFQTFRAMVVGQISQTRLRNVMKEAGPGDRAPGRRSGSSLKVVGRPRRTA